MKNSEVINTHKIFTFNKFIFSFCINLFLVLSVIFFAPMDIYFANVIEFSFPFLSAFVTLILTGVLAAALISFATSLFNKKIFIIINLILFGLGLCFYLQAMLMNGQMSSLTGETDVYGKKLIIINLLLWVLIIAAVFLAYFIFLKKHKEKTYKTLVKFISLALVVMQAAGFVSEAASAKPADLNKKDYLTTAGKFELSKNKNVIVFIVDTCDGNYVAEAMKKYPDLLKPFGGFTYFPNATSTHSRTYPSVPFLLTGKICHFDVPYREFVDSAFKESSFLPDIYNKGCDIRIFTDSQYIGASAKPEIANYSNGSNNKFGVSVPKLIKKMLKVSLYREAPYLIKPKFRYDIGEINSAVINLPDKNTASDDADFFKALKSTKLSLKDYSSAYRFYHLWGPHPGMTINKDAEKVPTDKTDKTEAIKGDFHIIEEYLKEMQTLGVYKNSTVIITADHGTSGGGTTNLEIESTACPLIMVKPVGEDKDTAIKISNAPVCHGDLLPTVIEAFGGDSKKYGRTVFEIKENEKRNRYYYYTSLINDKEGEIALREYLVSGDARNAKSWSLTGRNWDVNYSERAVSKKRLSDYVK